ncbi:Uma2 family endonuclease [Methylobacter tundripaludum]|uniref:Uma2 family endonuclease n=1 Tax=Methylobacter tundripaludum TaxID=173365 RepID=UPI0001E518F1|nr:Uma2 family endonuclease [Methylobacter tundripaludum]
MPNSAFVLPDSILTPEAYLLMENDNNTGTRHEFVNGLVYAMTGASRDHNRISGGCMYACRSICKALVASRFNRT